MMTVDVFSMATERRLEAERAQRRRQRLADAGWTPGPSLLTRLGALLDRATTPRPVRRLPMAQAPVTQSPMVAPRFPRTGCMSETA